MKYASNDKTSFQVVDEVSEALTPTAKQVAGYVMSHIQLNSENIQSFDWASFKNDIDSYKGDDLTFDSFSNKGIEEGDLKVSDIVPKIVAFCQAAGVTIKEEDLTTLISNFLIDLKQAKESGWADFSKSDDDPKVSGWECRVIFMIPHSGSTRFFKSILTTLKLQAKLEDEDSWFDIDGKTTLKGFKSTSDFMGLVVAKGFENPLFDAIYVNPSNDIIPPSLQIATFLNKHADSEDGLFDLEGFKKAVDEYPGDDLVYDKFSDGDFDESKQPFKEVVEKIIAITGDGEELGKNIMATFTALENYSRAGYLQFDQLADERSTWEYRVVLFVPMDKLSMYFNATVITVRIAANFEEESSWWNLTESTSKKFSAKVKALKLVVGAGFQYGSGEK
ncbi:volvatoxin A1 precursor [Collybia nuda]|uniref:Volvatoxin A1 n=1 Tax=Collybia nuda TaxID=64659 RepID=A0A9P6CM33_9AGAR|nr:volvatoxin A1 precursor [Collybia nuda]